MINFKKMKLFLCVSFVKLFFLLLIFILFTNCNRVEKITVSSIKVDNGWGYIIKWENKIIIKQTTIPTVPKHIGFKDSIDALKVGKFVLEKIKHNNSPTISKEDLKVLEIKI